MRIDLFRTTTVGIAGLVGAGLLALQVPSTSTAGAELLKRDEDGAQLTVVTEEDEAEDDDLALVADTRSRDTSRSKASRNSRGDDSRTGRASGRDDSRSGRHAAGADWTRDGKGGLKRDWSRHHTNDKSRNNTR